MPPFIQAIHQRIESKRHTAADQQRHLVVDVGGERSQTASYRLRGPLVALLQDHEHRVVRQRLEELLRVHPGAVLVQHQGADARHAQRDADLRTAVQTAARHTKDKH